MPVIFQSGSINCPHTSSSSYSIGVHRRCIVTPLTSPPDQRTARTYIASNQLLESSAGGAGTQTPQAADAAGSTDCRAWRSNEDKSD
jgi:hypothetical protein